MGKCYEQLSLSERIYIQSQLELGFKAAAIAAALKREPSTVSRELRHATGPLHDRQSSQGQWHLYSESMFETLVSFFWMSN
jgi:IS30 family transposase